MSQEKYILTQTLNKPLNPFTPKETALVEEDREKSLKAEWSEINHGLWKENPYTSEEENQKV